MSRTFRLRHMPALPGTARKFCDGVGVRSWFQRSWAAAREVSIRLGTPVRHPTGWHLDCAASTEESVLFYQIRSKVVVDVSFPYHPWAERKSWTRLRTEGKTKARRRMRRDARRSLRDVPELALWPQWGEHFNERMW